MKLIKLTKGLEAIVDDENYAWLNQWKWHSANGYAARKEYTKNEDGTITKRYVRMHRIVISAPDGYEVDHINRNPLDNRVQNLRLATNQQNTWNRKEICTNTSGYRGVHLRAHGKYRVHIMVDNKQISLGSYRLFEEAVVARQEAERIYYGDYSPLATD